MSAAHQLGLLEWSPPTAVAGPKASEQARQVIRVERGLAAPILAWCQAHEGEDFHLSAIIESVTGHVSCGHDSVRKILSELRRHGHVDYECIDRNRSLYRMGAVRG